MRIKVNAKACTGCRLCRQVCSMEKFGEVNPRKARIRIEAAFPDPGTYRPRACTQCGTCAKACPVEAIIRDERGVYSVDETKCTLCGACVTACPLGVMMRWENGVPYKCDYCWRCTDTCNTGAIIRVD